MSAEKPDWLPAGEIPTQRDWEQRARWNKKPNAIEEARRYLACLEDMPDGNHADVADAFGVSRARVRQMLGLLKTLPPEITDAVAGAADDRLRAFFSERRLRPPMGLPTVNDKLAAFEELVAQATRTGRPKARRSAPFAWYRLEPGTRRFAGEASRIKGRPHSQPG